MSKAVFAFLASCSLAAAQAQLSLNFCTGSPSQLFYFDAANSTIVLPSTGFCIDIFAYGNTPGSIAYTAACHHDDKNPAHQNQEFSALSQASPGAPIVEIMSNLTLDAGLLIAPGSPITLNNLSNASAFWLNVSSTANGGTGTIVHTVSGLCIDAAGAAASVPAQPIALGQCGDGADSSASRQAFTVNPAGTVQLALPSVLLPTPVCLSAASYSTSTRLTTGPCPPAGATVPASQAFKLDGQGNLVSSLFSNSSGTSVVNWADPTAVSATGWVGLPLQLTQPSPGSKWVLNSTGLPNGSARLVHVQSGLCMDVGGVPNSHGCLDPSVRGLPFCNPSLPVADRVADILSRLSLAEKISLTGSRPSSDTCDTVDPGVPRLDIPPQEWLVETNSMAASACYGSTCATSFPSALNLAASFNRTVWRAKGEVVSTEMRVLNNLRWHRADTQQGTMISLSGFGPDINQPRDPRNGRVGELPTEDPFIMGEYAVQYLLGLQTDPYGSSRHKMSAGVKHYAGYSMETNRFGSKGNFTTFDLWDTYLKPYEQAFVRGGSSGSMCAYISLSVDGGPSIPACANTYLLQTVVREYWDRPDAIHTSDCGAVANMADNNHYVKNYTYAAAAALNGGMDLNSNNILPNNLATAIEIGLTNETVLDAALARTLAVRIRLGLLDPLEEQPMTVWGEERLHTAEASALVQDATAQGIVLLKNTGNALPFKQGIKLAVVGPNAGTPCPLMGDYYADDVCPSAASSNSNLRSTIVNCPSFSSIHDYSCVPSIYAALAAANVGGSTVTFPGVQMSFNDTTWAQALAAVANSDATVMVLGTDQSIAHEGQDLASIALPGLQSQLGQAVLASAAGKPVVLLMIGTFPTAFDALLEPTPAIVLGYAPTFGAPALADTFFGKLNRWGRAQLTVYPAAYQSLIALGDFGMTSRPASDPRGASPGRTYRYYNGAAGPALVRQGQGISYSTFTVACSVAYVAPGSETLSFACNVSNTAGPDSDIVLQVEHRASPDIVARIGSAHPVPLSTVVAGDRFTVPAGTTVPVIINTTVLEALTLVDETGASVLYQGLHFLDVWDGGLNNITLAVEAPLMAGASKKVYKQPPVWQGYTV